MPNIGGPKQKRRILLSSVVTSVITYGIPIWSDVLEIQESRRKIARISRLSALRVASAFRTVSEDAACVISGILPIDILAEERKALYQRKAAKTPSHEKRNDEERQNSIRRWQTKWDTSAKGRWTYRLIPQLDVWLNRNYGEVNYYLTQMLSGHGCFREYLYRFNHDSSPECPACPGVYEDAEHVAFACPRFATTRNIWKAALREETRPESLVACMLSSKASWEATSTYTTEVLQELRRIERERAENRRNAEQ